MSITNVKEYTLPKGEYYLGDLCYTTLGSIQEDWMTYVCIPHCDSKVNHGMYKWKDGNTFFITDTYCGDGIYPTLDCNDEENYFPWLQLGVDSGTIGLINTNSIDSLPDNIKELSGVFDVEHEMYVYVYEDTDEFTHGLLIECFDKDNCLVDTQVVCFTEEMETLTREDRL